MNAIHLWMSQNDNEINAKCDICLDGDMYINKNQDEDQLLFCDGCNAVTHQSCYG